MICELDGLNNYLSGNWMEFCPSCGMRLVLKREMLNDVEDFLLVCPKCGYAKPVTHEEPFTPTMDDVKEVETSEQKLITIIDE